MVGRPFISRGCGLATDRKAVRRRGPGRVVLGSKPQLATTEELVSWVELVNWAGEQAAACDCQKTRELGSTRELGYARCPLRYSSACSWRRRRSRMDRTKSSPSSALWSRISIWCGAQIL